MCCCVCVFIDVLNENPVGESVRVVHISRRSTRKGSVLFEMVKKGTTLASLAAILDVVTRETHYYHLEPMICSFVVMQTIVVLLLSNGKGRKITDN